MIETVLIVEDVAATRQWLDQIVAEAFPACRRIAAATLREAEGQLARGEAIDLALIDLGLPDGSGIDLLHGFRKQSPQTVCVVTTVMGEDMHVVAALSAGAQGYLLKEQLSPLVVRQLQQAADGIPALSPAIAQRLIEHFRRTGPIVEGSDDLTRREKEVLVLIGRGLRNAEVAGALGLSDHTVAGYIKSIYRKLGIASRAEAAWHANQLGL